jgi:hypothetical protein
MLVLEDDRKIRLLAGLMPTDLEDRAPFSIRGSPTRFGRVSLSAEPSGARGWKMHFSREASTEPPEAVEIPDKLEAGAVLVRVEGAVQRGATSGVVNVDPAAAAWTAFWGS